VTGIADVEVEYGCLRWWDIIQNHTEIIKVKNYGKSK
jgi:hypothetical protein